MLLDRFNQLLQITKNRRAESADISNKTREARPQLKLSDADMEFIEKNKYPYLSSGYSGTEPENEGYGYGNFEM